MKNPLITGFIFALAFSAAAEYVRATAYALYADPRASHAHPPHMVWALLLTSAAILLYRTNPKDRT